MINSNCGAVEDSLEEKLQFKNLTESTAVVLNSEHWTLYSFKVTTSLTKNLTQTRCSLSDQFPLYFAILSGAATPTEVILSLRGSQVLLTHLLLIKRPWHGTWR